jgi:hypothetical protein
MTEELDATDDGGPAFPTTKPLDYWGDPNQGLSMRDYFAAAALQGIIAAHGNESNERVAAEYAYGYADAMIAERKGGGE